MQIATDHSSELNKLRALLDNCFGTPQDTMHHQQMRSLHGPFIDLWGQAVNDINFDREVTNALIQMVDDLQSVCLVSSIIIKVMKDNDSAFLDFEMRALIELYFFEVQSIFDYIACATFAAYGKKYRSSRRNRSKNWKPGFAERSQILLTGAESKPMEFLLKGAPIFTPLNTWRNAIAHRGELIKVTRLAPDIGFYVMNVERRVVSHWEKIPSAFRVKPDEPSVWFGAFSGYYAGLLIDYLNDWASILIRKLNLKKGVHGFSGPQIALLERTIQAAVALLEQTE